MEELPGDGAARWSNCPVVELPGDGAARWSNCPVVERHGGRTARWWSGTVEKVVLPISAD
jgi:hypothetical protein